MSDASATRPHRVLRAVAAHALSAMGMTVTVVASTVAANAGQRSGEGLTGAVAAIVAVSVGTTGVLAARALLDKPLATLWLAVPTLVLLGIVAASLAG